MLAQPGGSLHYIIPIPLDQEPGLYWYHTHVHGHTNFQVGQAGMSGAIIVTGLEHHLPGLGKMVEAVMIVVRDMGPSTTIRPRVTTDSGTNGMAGMSDMAGMNGAPAADEQPLPGGFRPNDTNPHPCGPDPQLFVTLNGAKSCGWGPQGCGICRWDESRPVADVRRPPARRSSRPCHSCPPCRSCRSPWSGRGRIVVLGPMSRTTRMRCLNHLAQSR